MAKQPRLLFLAQHTLPPCCQSAVGFHGVPNRTRLHQANGLQSRQDTGAEDSLPVRNPGRSKALWNRWCRSTEFQPTLAACRLRRRKGVIQDLLLTRCSSRDFFQAGGEQPAKELTAGIHVHGTEHSTDIGVNRVHRHTDLLSGPEFVEPIHESNGYLNGAGRQSQSIRDSIPFR